MGNKALYLIIPFCSIFIIIGASIMISKGRRILLGTVAASWPHTVGRMTSIESKDTSSPDISSGSREICVTYSYTVGGCEYQGTTIHPAYGGSDFEGAHSALEELLKPAKQVRVYYDPRNPSRCTLSHGIYSCSLANFFGGFIFFAAGIGFLLALWFSICGNQGFARGITVLE